MAIRSALETSQPDLHFDTDGDGLDSAGPSAAVWPNRPTHGPVGAPILIVCDPQQSDAARGNLAMSMRLQTMLRTALSDAGIQVEGDGCQVRLIALCPPLPKEAASSDRRRWAHVQPHVDAIQHAIHASAPAVVVPLGDLAARAVLGRQIKITKARGVPIVQDDFPLVLPIYSPSYVMRQPEHMPVFLADIRTLSELAASGFDPGERVSGELDYRYSWDLSEWLQNKPSVLAVDTETTGLTWYDPTVRALMVQLSDQEGRGVAVPIDPEYCRRWFPDTTPEMIATARAHLKQLLEDPTISKAGHHLGYDVHILAKEGIRLAGWRVETLQLVFSVNEDLQDKSLENVTRVYIPELAGYDEAFNRVHDKGRMIDVPPYDVIRPDGSVIPGMLNYACGDVDAVIRLGSRLTRDLRNPNNQRQFACFRLIQMPALRAFKGIVEHYGVAVDAQKVRDLEAQLTAWKQEETSALMRMIPAAVRRRHLGEEKGKKRASFTRSAFVADALFSPDGFNLRPVMFTPSTEHLPPAEQVPQTGKDHLMYLVTAPGKAGEFCARLMELQKVEKLLSTYVGIEAKQSGFWKYLSDPDEQGTRFLHPTYSLHITNTGRTASSSPNGQNFPKRGRWAKPFMETIVARPGYSLIAADLSQIELRLAAWMANERTMLGIYRDGGDIHKMTAASTMRLSLEEFTALESGIVKDKRGKAKAVNFGFIYGMSAPGFRVYAKTDYGLDYSEAESEETRQLYFETYSGLPDWHDRQKAFARRHGYVEALHGARRHLPSINSTDSAIRALAERQAINAPVQRFGSDLGLIALIRFSAQIDPRVCRILAFVHDQLVAEVLEGHELEYASYLKWAMETPPLEAWFGPSCRPPLPILSEVDLGLASRGEASMGKMREAADMLKEGLIPHAVLAERPSFWRDDLDERGALAQFEYVWA